MIQERGRIDLKFKPRRSSTCPSLSLSRPVVGGTGRDWSGDAAQTEKLMLTPAVPQLASFLSVSRPTADGIGRKPAGSRSLTLVDPTFKSTTKLVFLGALTPLHQAKT